MRLPPIFVFLVKMYIAFGANPARTMMVASKISPSLSIHVGDDLTRPEVDADSGSLDGFYKPRLLHDC